ncbi:subtilisin-like protein [Ramicandelaber brevisporus]|nr:subtilisin-like protein [Ramicandelaber brevisporus]
MVRISLLSAAIAATAAIITVSNAAELIPGRYIVEMETTPEPARAEIRAKADDASSLLGNLGINAEVKHRYGLAFPGMAVQLANDADVDRLRKAPGVKRVIPVRRYRIEPPRTLAVGRTAFTDSGEEFSLAEPMRQVHNLTDLFAARQKYGLTGKGIKVGVIDSGIDYTHPDLGGCFGEGCRVQYGFNFPDKTTDPNNPIDCFYHGTHVAGIIGAQGTEVSGVAPEATLGAYRIGSCLGDIEESDVVAAIERSLADGMDVINMSLGWFPRYPWDVVSVAVKNAVKQGLIAVISNGNSGPQLYTARTPGVVDGAISVGAINNYIFSSYALSATIPGQGTELLPILEFGQGTNDRRLAGAGTRQVAVANSGDRAANCSISNIADLAGKAVVWEQTDIICGYKAFEQVLSTGPGALLFPATTPFESIAVNYTSLYNSGIPNIVVSKETIAKFKDGLTKGQVTVTGLTDVRAIKNQAAGQLANFSSRGPSAELQLKPQVSLPGGNIYSTFPVRKGSYAVLSGTSMSAPYVTGLVALYLQQRGKQTPERVQAALQNAAHNKIARQPGLFDGFDSPANIGSGLVNASVLLDPNTTLLTPSQLALNDTGRPGFFGSYIRPLTITNNAKVTVTYDLGHEASIAVAPSWNKTIPQLYAKAAAAVTFSQSVVTIPAGRSQSIRATIVPPSGLDEKAYYAYGGWLVAKPRDASLTAVKTVYLGVKGNFANAEIFSDAIFSLNFVDKLPDGTPVFDPYRDFFSSGSVVQRYASRHIEAFYEDANGRNAGYLAYAKNVGSYIGSQFQLADYTCEPDQLDKNSNYCSLADGKPVKPGKYRIAVRAQRPFTVDANPRSYQTAYSQWFFLNSSRPATPQQQQQQQQPQPSTPTTKV